MNFPEQDHALNRRQFLAQAGLLGLGTLLAGCSDVLTVQPDTDKLVVALAEDILVLDPAYAVRALDGFVICNIHENLTWYGRDLKLVPRLALSWDTPDGGTTWIFKLRPGVQFQDGTPFNAAAVKFHFDRLKDPATKSKRVTKVARLASVDALDELTVRFNMTEPYGMWPAVLRDSFAAIVSPAAVEKLGNDHYGEQPVGTGPYRFVEQESERFVRLEKNPAYWNADAITLQHVEFRPVKEPTTRLILLEQGRVDVADISFAHTEVAERAGRVRLLRETLLADRYIGFNCMKAPFDDVRMRRACNHAVNRVDLIRYAFRGNADISVGPLPPSMPAFNKDMETYTFDPDRARALIREAGHGKGVHVNMWCKDDVMDTNLGVVVADQLAHVGIHVNLLRFDRTVYWDMFDPYQTAEGKWFPTKDGVFDMYAAGWVGGEHPHGFLDPLFRSTSYSNSSFYKNAEVDRLLSESLKATEAERDAIYAQLQAIIVQDAPWIFSYHPRTLWGVSNRVANLHVHPAGEYEFAGVTLGGDTGRI